MIIIKPREKEHVLLTSCNQRKNSTGINKTFYYHTYVLCSIKDRNMGWDGACLLYTCNARVAIKEIHKKYLKFNCDKKNFDNKVIECRPINFTWHSRKKICQQIRKRMELMRVELHKKIGLEFQRFHANQVPSSIQHCCKKRWWNGEFFTCQPAHKNSTNKKIYARKLKNFPYTVLSVSSSLYIFVVEKIFAIRKMNQFG